MTAQEVLAAGSAAAELDSYLTDSFKRVEPDAALAMAQRYCPVHRSSVGVWTVSKYDDIRAVLRDNDSFSRSEADHGDLPVYEGLAADYYTARMLWNDRPAHTRLRRLVSNVFTPAAVQRWQPWIEEVVGDLLDELAPRGEMDVVRELGYPLSENVIFKLVGVPYEDHKKFEGWMAALVEPAKLGEDLEPHRAAGTAAMLGFADYVIERKRRLTADDDDLLARLAKAEEDGETLSEVEVVGLCLELIGAGHESTANLIANGLYYLLKNPDQYSALVADRSLLDTALPEIFRLGTPAPFTLARLTTADVEVGGTVIPKGERVICVLDAGDRDPEVFEDPSTFDILRAPNPHLAFGSGTHSCIGRNLALLEARIVFDVVLDRLPNLRLVDRDPSWREHAYFRGHRRLDVRWSTS
jgi:pimeloyl-[acyl-carrier protein] synthase